MTIIPILEKLKARHRENRISDRHYLGLYLLVRHYDRFVRGQYSSAAKKSSWRSSGDSKTLWWELQLRELFEGGDLDRFVGPACNHPVLCGCFQSLRLRFLSVGAQLTWHHWSSGQYPLSLMHDLPTPEAMLEAQAHGRRWISLLDKSEQHCAPVERFGDAFEFVIHDLEHAHHFFHDSLQYFVQVAFYDRIAICLRDPVVCLWSQLAADDPLFAKDLNYALSDMNSHGWHLIQYVNAVTIRAMLRKYEPKEIEGNITELLSEDAKSLVREQWAKFYEDLGLSQNRIWVAAEATAALLRYGREKLAGKRFSEASIPPG